MEEKFKILKTTSLPDSEIEIETELAYEAVLEFKQKSLANLQSAISLPGFRKGHVPEKIIIEKLGDMAVLEECVELALAEYYLDIVKMSGKDIVGAPKVSITKLAPGNPVSLKIVVAEIPNIKLPEYKPIAKSIVLKKENVSVDENEVDAAKVIADYAFKIFLESPKMTDFFLSGPSTQVRIRVFVIQENQKSELAA